MLRLKEESVVRVSFHVLLVLRINISYVPLVLVELIELFFPALKFIHLLLVLIFLFDDSTLLLLSSSSKRFSLFCKLFLSHLELFVVHYNLLKLILSLLTDSPFFNHVYLLIVLIHQCWQLVLHGLQLLIVDDEKNVGEHL